MRLVRDELGAMGFVRALRNEADDESSAGLIHHRFDADTSDRRICCRVM